MADPFDAERIDMEGRAAPSKPSQPNLGGWIASSLFAPASRPMPLYGGRFAAGVSLAGGSCRCERAPRQT
ncbi:hypothetical protein MACH23_37400 [Sulfitobacter pontiacus]|nr:hypothetical protein MACH23_37400 [Sulfitobacter pontiacus]